MAAAEKLRKSLPELFFSQQGLDGAVAAAEQPAIEDAAVLAALKASSKARAPAKLADVFRDLQAKRPGWTLGQYHDCLRRLHAAGQIKLEPWTQAMYRLPDPEACLLAGREVMAFVSAC